MRRFDFPIELEPWLERTACTGEDAARVRELLADRIHGGDVVLDRIALRGAGRPEWRSSSTATRGSLVQGLTGSEGRFFGLRNRDYGTNVVAGVTPGKGGQDVDGIPVFDTVAAAVAATGANATLVFVPARFAADAVYEAADAGIATAICITEHVPAHDMLRLAAYLRARGVTLIGPNCPGVLSPGKANAGIIPAEVFREGSIGLVSRSGTLTYQIGYELAQLGLGNSSIVGIGGDPIVGSTFVDVLERFEADPETETVVLVGEIGGDEEEKAARLRRRADDEAGVRLHRGLLGAARQDDGPRRRDHLRLGGHGAGEEGGARGGRDRGRHDADRGRAARRRARSRRRLTSARRPGSPRASDFAGSGRAHPTLDKGGAAPSALYCRRYRTNVSTRLCTAL